MSKKKVYELIQITFTSVSNMKNIVKKSIGVVRSLLSVQVQTSSGNWIPKTLPGRNGGSEDEGPFVQNINFSVVTIW